MRAAQRILDFLDERIYLVLMRSHRVLPLRWRKLLAMYYPDARVRKLYWGTLNVSMGEGTYANPGLTVVNSMEEECRIVIGAHVSIAPNVVIVTDSSPNNAKVLSLIPYVKEKLIRKRPVRIEDEVWLGAGAIVLPGVVIGRGAIVGAGAVITGDVPPFCIAAGVPAKVIRTLQTTDVSSTAHCID